MPKTEENKEEEIKKEDGKTEENKEEEKEEEKKEDNDDEEEDKEEENEEEKKEDNDDEEKDKEEEEKEEEKKEDNDDEEEEEEEYKEEDKSNTKVEETTLMIKIDGFEFPCLFNVLNYSRGDETYSVIEVNQKWLKNLTCSEKKRKTIENEYKKLLEYDLNFQKKVVLELKKYFNKANLNLENVMLVNKFDGIFAGVEKNYINEDKTQQKGSDEIFDDFEKAKNTEGSIFNKNSLGALVEKIENDNQKAINYREFNRKFGNKNNIYDHQKHDFNGLVCNEYFKFGMAKFKVKESLMVKPEYKDKIVIMFEPYFSEKIQGNDEAMEQVRKDLLNIQREHPGVEIVTCEASNYQSFYLADLNNSKTLKGKKVNKDKSRDIKQLIGEKIKNNADQINKEVEKNNQVNDIEGQKAPGIIKKYKEARIDNLLSYSRQLKAFADRKYEHARVMNQPEMDFDIWFEEDMKKTGHEGEQIAILYNELLNIKEEIEFFFKLDNQKYYLFDNNNKEELTNEQCEKINEFVKNYNEVFKKMYEKITNNYTQRYCFRSETIWPYKGFLDAHKEIDKDAYKNKDLIEIPKLKQNMTFKIPEIPLMIPNNNGAVLNHGNYYGGINPVFGSGGA